MSRSVVTGSARHACNMREVWDTALLASKHYCSKLGIGSEYEDVTVRVSEEVSCEVGYDEYGNLSSPYPKQFIWHKAKLRSIDAKRKESRRLDHVPIEDDEIEDYSIHRTTDETLINEIESYLNDKMLFTIFYLRMIEGCSYNEIIEIINKDIDSKEKLYYSKIKSLLLIIIEKLKIFFEGKYFPVKRGSIKGGL